MIKNLLLFFLLQPSGLFTRMRGCDLFRLALVLQFFRWEVTALTTMVSLYQEQSPMLLPTPFGIDQERYRLIEIFAYGPYGLLVMTGIAYLGRYLSRQLSKVFVAYAHNSRGMIIDLPKLECPRGFCVAEKRS